MGGICALFGLPWLAAATVRSVTHANALTVMSKAVAPGDKPKIQEVKEQRVTGLLVALLVGLSLVIGDLLRQIPWLCSLGFSCTWVSPPLTESSSTSGCTCCSCHPNTTQTSPTSRRFDPPYAPVHGPAAALPGPALGRHVHGRLLAFPFILILTVPLRMVVLTRIFTEREMKCLDANEAEPVFDEREGVDEYNEMPMPV